MKVISWNQNEIFYSWNKLVVFGAPFDSDTFGFYFPRKKKKRSPIKLGSASYILRNYQISRFGNGIKYYINGEGKKDLEDEINKSMKEDYNKKILIEMIFNDEVEIEG